MDLKVSDTGDTLDHLITEHDTCFAHSLQLVIHDRLKSAGQPDKNLAKAGKLVSNFRHSIHASELLEGLKRLKPSNQTRWNSQLSMVRSILSTPESKLHELQPSPPPPLLCSCDMNILANFLKVLTLRATNTFLPAARSHVSEVRNPSLTDFNCKFVTALKSSFEWRMALYESRPILQIATKLDDDDDDDDDDDEDGIKV